MADSETTQVTTKTVAASETPQDISQQVTAKTPATRVKDPKKVAAGKALQQKNREAREAQKKFVEAQQKELVEAKNKIKELESAKAADTPLAEPAKNVMTTTQWLSVISIVVSLAGLYYKRKEIKGLLTKKNSVETPPSPVAPQRKGGIKPMD